MTHGGTPDQITVHDSTVCYYAYCFFSSSSSFSFFFSRSFVDFWSLSLTLSLYIGYKGAGLDRACLSENQLENDDAEADKYSEDAAARSSAANGELNERSSPELGRKGSRFSRRGSGASEPRIAPRNAGWREEEIF